MHCPSWPTCRWRNSATSCSTASCRAARTTTSPCSPCAATPETPSRRAEHRASHLAADLPGWWSRPLRPCRGGVELGGHTPRDAPAPHRPRTPPSTQVGWTPWLDEDLVPPVRCGHASGAGIRLRTRAGASARPASAYGRVLVDVGVGLIVAVVAADDRRQPSRVLAPQVCRDRHP